MGGRGSGWGGQEGGERQILSKRVRCHVLLKLTAGTLSLVSGVLRERNTGEEIKAVFVDYLLGFLMFSMEVFLQ